MSKNQDFLPIIPISWVKKSISYSWSDRSQSIAQLLAAGQARRHKRQVPPMEMDSTRMIRDDRDESDRLSDGLNYWAKA